MVSIIVLSLVLAWFYIGGIFLMRALIKESRYDDNELSWFDYAIWPYNVTHAVVAALFSGKFKW